MVNKFARFVREFISAPNSSEPRLIPFSALRGNGRLVAGAVLSILLAGTLSASPRFSPGFTYSTLYTRAGDPGAWVAGIQSFDFGSDGTLYVFAENRYIVKDPAGVNEVLYDFGSATWGSFLKLDNDSPQNVWFAESMTGAVQSVVSDGGLGQVPTPRGTRGYNFDMAVNSGNQVFVSANTGWSDPNKIWFWKSAAWQELAGMDGSSGPITFDAADNLYYGFAQYNSTQEEVVYFTDAQIQPVIAAGPVLSDADAATYAEDLNTNYGLAYEAANADIFSSSSLGTVTRITGQNEHGPFGCGDSPSVVRCWNGDAYLLCTDWSDYESTIFRLQPHSTVPVTIMKNQGGDQNLYVYNALAAGETIYCDAYACNPEPQARDFWLIPAGDDTSAMTEVDAGDGGAQELALIKGGAGTDQNLYLYNNPARGDRTYWDADARNPSALARDLWLIPAGNDTVLVADGGSHIVSMRDQGGDYNLYLWTSPEPGDWSYWAAMARNPSALARDLWIIPQGDDAAAMCGMDTTGDGDSDSLLVVRNEGGDYNLYLWNMPVPGDWTYGDALARNPDARAKDLWLIPRNDDISAVAGVDVDGAGNAYDALAVMENNGGDYNFFVWNAPRPGDLTYWDAFARNPSAMARDMWLIPAGNNAVDMAAPRPEPTPI